MGESPDTRGYLGDLLGEAIEPSQKRTQSAESGVADAEWRTLGGGRGVTYAGFRV